MTKIGTEVAHVHVTRGSDTTFMVKRSKVKVTGAGAYCGGLPPTACFRIKQTVIAYVVTMDGCNIEQTKYSQSQAFHVEVSSIITDTLSKMPFCLKFRNLVPILFILQKRIRQK